MGSILTGEGKPGSSAPGGRLFGVVPREGVFQPEGSGTAFGFFPCAGGGKPMRRATV